MDLGFESSEEMLRRAKEELYGWPGPGFASPSAARTEPSPAPEPDAAPSRDRAPAPVVVPAEDREEPPGVAEPVSVPPTEPPRRTLPVPLVVFIVALVAIGVTLGILTSGDESGDAATTDSVAVVTDPEPGTCLLDPDDGAYASLEPVACSEPHDLEVFALVALPDGPDAPLPAEQELFDAAWERCRARFRRYTGERWEDSPFQIQTYVPDPEGWRAGDRTVSCMLFMVDDAGNPIRSTGSGRGRGV